MDFDEAVRVMGLSTAQDIDPGVVRKAYLRRALEVHPDRCRMRRDGNDGDNWVGMDVPPRGFSAASAAGENTHDATSSTSSKEEFQRLRTAYEVMMEVIGTSTGSAGGRVDVDADMGDILMRALRGEDVREVLAKRGGWRPGNGFGVDYGVVWGGRRVDGVDEEGEEGDGWREALERGLEVDGDTDIETDGSA